MRLRTFSAGVAMTVLLGGCFGGGDPEVVPEPANPRSVCDSYAAQAIQAQDLSVATTLSAQASQCYSEIQARQR